MQQAAPVDLAKRNGIEGERKKRGGRGSERKREEERGMYLDREGEGGRSYLEASVLRRGSPYIGTFFRGIFAA